MKIVPVIKKARRLTNKAKRAGKTLVTTSRKLKYYYAFLCNHCEVDQKRMLLESFHGKGVSDSSLAVLQEMMRQGIADQYEIFFASDDIERDRPIVENNALPVTLVHIESRRYAYVLATAKYLLNNSSFPLWFMRRPEQIYVQTWHGTPLKTLGKEMRLGIESMVNVQHNFIQASWLTFPNDFTRDVIMRDYNLDALYTGKVAMVGYPRNTVFLMGKNDSIRTEYALDEATTFAYMPTWRGTSNHSVDIARYADTVASILRKLDKQLRDDQRVYVNFHSMVAAFITLDSYDHIFPFPSTVGTYDFLSQIDVLITDYSSVMFDFALTKRPVILFTYDEEQYLADRGMYFPLESLPFTKVSTTKELCDCIANQAYELSAEDLNELHDRFLTYDSAQNSAQVLSLLLGEVPSDVPVIDYSHNLQKTWDVVEVPHQRTRADLNSIFLSSDSPNDLVVLNRVGFGQVKSAHLYDNYKDRTFLFVNKQLPHTPWEEVARHFWKPTNERYLLREQHLLYGDLSISPNTRVTSVTGLADSTFSPELATQMPGAFVDNTSEVQLTFDAGELTPLKIMLRTRSRIRWSRDLTQQEFTDRTIHIDVTDVVGDSVFGANQNTRAQLCMLVRDTEGQLLVADLMGDQEQSEHIAPYVPVDTKDLGSIVTYDEDGKCGIALLDKSYERQVVVASYLDSLHTLSLLFTYEEFALQGNLRPYVVSARTPNDERLLLTINIEKNAYNIEGVEFHNRTAGSNTIQQLSFSVTDKKDHTVIHATFDPRNRVFDGIFWDLFVVVSIGNGKRYQLACYTSDAFRHSLFFRNLQCVLPDGNVVFPYATVGSKLAMVHRPWTEADNGITKLKEWSAFFLYYMFLPYWHRRHIWLVYEKFCSLAQDNGYAFFSYCMQQSDAKKHIYYVMDPSSPEYGKLAEYQHNVVDFMSFRHMLYALAASIYIGSDAKSHLYQWRPKPSVVRKLIARRPIFFLQHGVTAFKRVDYLFGKRGSSPMTYFLTTSHAEQNVVVDNFGYDSRHAPVLGFSRWDLLQNTADPSHPTILLMPTWRQWLEDVDDQTFLGSEYYQMYSSLINSPQLAEFLEQHNATLKFFIHPKMSAQLRHFGSISKSIELIDLGSAPLNELIMECSMLITDYSSVAWDVLYMDKPVAFYQFDQARYIDEVGSYIDLNKALPGPLAKTEDKLIAALNKCADRGFTLDKKSKKRASKWFDFRDDRNRKRTYDFLKSEDL